MGCTLGSPCGPCMMDISESLTGRGVNQGSVLVVVPGDSLLQETLEIPGRGEVKLEPLEELTARFDEMEREAIMEDDRDLTGSSSKSSSDQTEGKSDNAQRVCVK